MEKLKGRTACNALGFRMAIILQAITVTRMLVWWMIHTFLGLNLAV